MMDWVIIIGVAAVLLLQSFLLGRAYAKLIKTYRNHLQRRLFNG